MNAAPFPQTQSKIIPTASTQEPQAIPGSDPANQDCATTDETTFRTPVFFWRWFEKIFLLITVIGGSFAAWWGYSHYQDLLQKQALWQQRWIQNETFITHHQEIQAQNTLKFSQIVAQIEQNHQQLKDFEKQLKAAGESQQSWETNIWRLQLRQVLYLAERERLQQNASMVLPLLQYALRLIPVEALETLALKQALETDIDHLQQFIKGTDLSSHLIALSISILQLSPISEQLTISAVNTQNDVNPRVDSDSDTAGWRAWSGRILAHLKQLVRVRHHNDPALPILLDEQQTQSAHLLLQLLLQQAQAALTERQIGVFHHHLDHITAILQKFFINDTQATTLQHEIVALRAASSVWPMRLTELESVTTFARLEQTR